MTRPTIALNLSLRTFVDTGIITERLEWSNYGRYWYCCCYTRRTHKINKIWYFFIFIFVFLYLKLPVILMPPRYKA